MSENELDKGLPATPHKLEKAKEKGQVAKSADVVGTLTYLTAVAYLTWEGWKIAAGQFRFDQGLIAQASHMQLTLPTIGPLIQQLIIHLFLQFAPFFLLLLLAAILGNLIQTGPVLSFHAIKPDWDRLNPASGFKRVFGVRTLFMGLRAILKLLFLGIVSYLAIKKLFPHFFQMASMDAHAVLRSLLNDLSTMGFQIGIVLAIIAIIDLAYTRFDFGKKMRMSMREMKDEIKHREGDPRIRARLRDLRRDLLKRSLAISRTREADVLITNPTHIAIALRYVHGEMASPQLLAKGKGIMAAAMRNLAARHQIPVVQNPSLARSLYKSTGIDQHVPSELFPQVARIIVWVLAKREAMRKNSETKAPSTPAQATLFPNDILHEFTKPARR